MKYVWVVHEIEGGSIRQAFSTEEDAKSYLNWEEYEGNLLRGYYKVSKVLFTDFK